MRRKSNLSDDIFLMVDFDNRVCFSFGFIRDLLDNSFVSLFGRDILGDRCSLNREIVEFLADKFSFRIESVDIREIVSSAVSEVKLWPINSESLIGNELNGANGVRALEHSL